MSPLLVDGGFDEVYQLAADMGGMGFIHSAECEIMHNNALINLNMVDAASLAGARRYFYSSSVCIYRDMEFGEAEMAEADAYPALPDNEYGWEKLYSERVAQAYGRNTDLMSGSLGSRTATAPTAPGTAAARRPPPQRAGRSPRSTVEGMIEVWGDGRPCARTPTSTTWSTASCV